VVSIFQVELSHTPTPLAVLIMALVRETLLAAGLEATSGCVLLTTLDCANLNSRSERAVLGTRLGNSLCWIRPEITQMPEWTELHYWTLSAANHASETHCPAAAHIVPIMMAA
jgi:hypothetical protein